MRRLSGIIAFCAAMQFAAPALAMDGAGSADAPGAARGGLLGALGSALGDEALAAHRGGQQDAFFNDMRSRATMSQTSATNVGTGMNAISENAFSNANGFPMVIQNTGNNVIIQNSTILNLRLQ